jgi:Skp family chaperone for outer membrane proteins
VNRTVAFVAGVLTLGVAIYAGTRLGAQPPAVAHPAGAGTRVAILNLRFVIKNYDKYKAFLEDVKRKDQAYVRTIKEKNEKAESLKKEAAKTPPPSPQRREAIEQELTNLSRDVQDITKKARTELARLGAEEMVRVYREIRDATYRYADQNHIDLVVHFEGAADKDEMNSPVLIQRNFNLGCCPLYWKPGLDISGSVLEALNAAYKRSVGTLPGTRPASTAAPTAPATRR